MDWFHAQEGEQKGPVSEADLAQLAATGVVAMAEWQPFRTAAATFETPFRACDSCGNRFASTELAVFAESAICGACQPAYVQRPRQGRASTHPGVLRYAGFRIRFLAIDVIVLFCYYAYFNSRFRGTPGKVALGLKIVRPDGGPISVGQAIGRYFAYMLSAIILCVGYMMAGWDDQKRALHDRICETRVIRTR